MTLVTLSPLGSLTRLQDDVARLVKDALDVTGASDASVAPAVDIVERDEELVLLADLPGADVDSIDVSVDRRTLKLSGERRGAAELGDGHVHRAERGAGTFVRTFELPGTVDSSLITAEYKDGVLRVVVPKSDEERARRVEVNAG